MSWLKAGIYLAAAAMVFGCSRPNFTGIWKLDPARSGMKDVSITLDIRHEEPKLHMAEKVEATDAGIGKFFEYDYTIDGRETAIEEQDVTEKSIAKWEGNELVIAVARKTGQVVANRHERWALSSDRRTLTRHMTYDDAQPPSISLVFRKPNAGIARMQVPGKSRTTMHRKT
jgi:hypothetical protein